MIKFDFWDTVLICVFLFFYYAWPIIMIIDGYVMYRIIQYMKSKRYKRVIFLVPVAVVLSVPLIYLLIQWLNVVGY
ncbi:hypothetical protein [Photorhabdus sp. CRCIA-P01]|uniref:hypothetical protein n=1 Tax=Photorhabdus sp. CRCIA-P01 TaxID=2019570 RepID=UPI000E59F54D|nr:hypothetical protein [Photorhabdus sp. CRCIA-P01]